MENKAEKKRAPGGFSVQKPVQKSRVQALNLGHVQGGQMKI